MNFIDRMKYDAVVTGPNTFDVTLSDGYVAATAGVEYVVHIKDDAGVSAGAIGSRTGTVFTVSQWSLAGTTTPIFGAGTTIYASLNASLLDRAMSGTGAIACVGQSNHLNWDGANVDAERDYAHPSVTQFKYQALDISNAVIDAASDGTRKASTPLYWFKTSTATTGGEPVIHGANGLVIDEGFRALEILPTAQDGAGYSGNRWNKGDPCYERLVAMIISFLQRNPTNYIALFLDIGGEQDTITGSGIGADPNDYKVALYQMYQDVFSDVLIATGVDISDTPIVIVSMNDAMATGNANYAAIQAIRADFVNDHYNSAHINLAGEPAIDAYHSDITVARKYREWLPDAYRRARLNIAPPAAGPISATIDTAIVTSTAFDITPVVEGVGVAAAIDTAIDTSTAFDITPVVAAGSSTPLTDALNLDFVGLPNDFVLDASGNVTQWNDHSGSGNHFLERSAANGGTVDASGNLDLTGGAHGLDLATQLLGQAGGFTLIAEIWVDPANANPLIGAGGKRLAIFDQVQFIDDINTRHHPVDIRGAWHTIEWCHNGVDHADDVKNVDGSPIVAYGYSGAGGAANGAITLGYVRCVSSNHEDQKSANQDRDNECV